MRCGPFSGLRDNPDPTAAQSLARSLRLARLAERAREKVHLSGGLTLMTDPPHLADKDPGVVVLVGADCLLVGTSQIS
jgi:hypothetical protein